MSLRWSAKHWPIIERAKHGLLPERLSVAEITQLLPLGDDFARTLLEECAIYMHRQGSGLPTDEDEAGFPSPPPDAGEGLRFDDAVNTGTLLRRMLDHPNRYEIDPPDCNPYNGHFYLIHRDDLRAYLERNGLWPLPEDAALRTWWPEEVGQPASADAAPTETTGGTGQKTRYRSVATEVLRICIDDYRRHHGTDPDRFQCRNWLKNYQPIGYRISWSEDKVCIENECLDDDLFGRRFRSALKKLKKT